MPKKQSKTTDRLNYKHDLYDELGEAAYQEATKIKIAPKDKGILSVGFSKPNVPEDKTPKHLQLASTRDRVGSKWPGPGKKLHGKASPSSEESFMRQAKNKEQSGR